MFYVPDAIRCAGLTPYANHNDTMSKTCIAACLSAALCVGTATASAEAGADAVNTSRELIKLTTDVRVDHQNVWHSPGGYDEANSGFTAKYLIFKLEGEIVPGLDYSWRQRLNRPLLDGQVFEATDWIYLRYTTGCFNVAAGKEVVAIGGYEYDAYPVDLYGTSVFWANVPCFQLGASAGVHLGSSSSLTAQVSQSPFHTSDCRAMYAYSVLWNGHFGAWHTLWSANLLEFERGRYINYISLGNRFDFDRVSLITDVMNRYARGQAFFGKDMTVVADLRWQPLAAWAFHAKYTYDVNKSGTGADLIVLDGTDQHQIGGGVEYYPLIRKRTSLRLHLNCYHSWGGNANEADVMCGNTTMLDMGITWHMNLFSLKK